MVNGYRGARRFRRTPNPASPSPLAKLLPIAENEYASNSVLTRDCAENPTNTIPSAITNAEANTNTDDRRIRLSPGSALGDTRHPCRRGPARVAAQRL